MITSFQLYRTDCRDVKIVKLYKKIKKYHRERRHVGETKVLPHSCLGNHFSDPLWELLVKISVSFLVKVRNGRFLNAIFRKISLLQYEHFSYRL